MPEEQVSWYLQILHSKTASLFKFDGSLTPAVL